MLRLATVLSLIASPALAAQNCAPRDTVLGHLSERFGEGRRAIGLVGQNQVMELFASSETGTWTITVTLPDGRMCLVVAGQAFESVSEAAAPAGVDS